MLSISSLQLCSQIQTYEILKEYKSVYSNNWRFFKELKKRYKNLSINAVNEQQ